MCINICVSHIFNEGMNLLMSGEDERGQDIQLLLCVDVISLEAHDVEAQSKRILEKADLEIYFRQ